MLGAVVSNITVFPIGLATIGLPQLFQKVRAS
jgi:hypothetical protein